MRSSRAAASAGICSAWQMWQALSGPWVWAWGSVAPTAKYSNAAQASTASARRTMVRPKIAFCQYILSKLYLSTFDGRTCLFVASLTVKVNDSSGPLLDFNVRRVHLTLQPFRPKLRLSKHMQAKTKRIRILALLLGVIFLGAQFHFCTDLTSTPSASHICPVCSTAATVVATQSPVIAIVPVTNRLEVAPLLVPASSAVPRATSPRSPPAL